MKFLHINSSDNASDIENLVNAIKNKDDVFILIYMEGCGPCNMTRPEWEKLESSKLLNTLNNNNNIYIVDIEKDYLDKLSDVMNTQNIEGFPTIRSIIDGKEEDYEQSNVPDKSRKTESFAKWIELKTKNNTSIGGGGKRETRRIRRTIRKKTRRIRTKKNIKKGGKWSLKYKKSINCKRPKGFSQKQHCKYGRKK
jgi:hypothetical protein